MAISDAIAVTPPTATGIPSGGSPVAATASATALPPITLLTTAIMNAAVRYGWERHVGGVLAGRSLSCPCPPRGMHDHMWDRMGTGP
jgi:hypothetical protein